MPRPSGFYDPPVATQEGIDPDASTEAQPLTTRAPVPTSRTAFGTSAELPLPPVSLRFMGEDDAQYLAIGRGLADLLGEFGLTDDSRMLDVGCGYGRLAIGILGSRRFRGTYLGFDILRGHIRWCRESITRAFPNVRFEVLNLHNERYNPAGRLDPTTARFPARSGSMDLCAATSVFTHLDLPTTEHYLDEIRRVLRPGGVAVTTWFIYDDARLPAATSDQSKFPMRTQVGAVNRIAFPEEPLKAIGYDEAYVRTSVVAAGLAVVTIEHGRWDGSASGRTTQDLVVLRREGGPSFRDRVGDTVAAIRGLLRRVRRRLGRVWRPFRAAVRGRG